MKQVFTTLVLTYLKVFARLQLAKNRNAVVIGVTGSAGKSSAVEAIAKVVALKGQVKATRGTNSESGIPLDILGLSPRSYSPLDWCRLLLLAPVSLLTHWEHFDYYVVEMGIDSPAPPKNMGYLLTIIKPDIGVVLNAGLVHGTYFDHLVKDRDPRRRAHKIVAAIAREKMRLLTSLPPTAVAIYNADQPELKACAKEVVARTITFGRSRSAKLRHTSQVSSRGSRYTFTYQHQESKLRLSSFLEEGYASSFAAALAVGAALGIPLSNASTVLTDYAPPAGRLCTFAGVRGITLLDSSYNASPATMHSALRLLARVSAGRPTAAIVGDMRELGLATKGEHKALAEWLTKYSDQALLFGEATRDYTLPLLTARHYPARHFARMDDLIAYAKDKLPDRALVLIKGSQNTLFLERAVSALLANKRDASKLCRRGPRWDRLRARTP